MTSPGQRGLSGRVDALFTPVDIAFLVFFRVFFAAMMLWALWEFHSKNLIASLYIDPSFHFTFHGFSWVKPWPGNGMHIHFALLALAALFVMAGLLYRASALLMFLGFTYVFLLEKAVYLNHYYLMCLLALLLVFMPAHRACSVDALLRPALRSHVVPAWTLWLLRFQIGLPYAMGGIAKLNWDWLQGQPMQLWLSVSAWRVVLGPVATERWFALAFSWGGLVFDLAIVPLLLWRRTRAAAFLVAVVFHLLNAFMLDIGVFPWLMIGATTVFFAPDWPRRLVSVKRPTEGDGPVAHTAALRPSLVVVCLLLLYVIVQLAAPFRHWFYPGNVLWTEEGAMFAWQMMLRDKRNAIGIMVADVDSGVAEPVDPRNWLSPQQVESMGHDPEMMREFANYLRQRVESEGRRVTVRILALCSLNGRKPQFMVDPAVDLSQQPRTWLHQPYIVPLREPFRDEPWEVPQDEWPKHVGGLGQSR